MPGTRKAKLIAEFLEFPLTFVFYEDAALPGVMHAHCLELDIVGQGKDVPHARRDLMDAVEAYVAFKCEEGEHDSIYCPAPAEVWNTKPLERWTHGVLVRCYLEPATQEHRAEVSFLPNATRLDGLALTPQ